MLFTFYPSHFFRSCGKDDQRAAEGRRQQGRRESRRRGWRWCVCVYFTKKRHWFRISCRLSQTQVSSYAIRCSVQGLSLSPSLPVDHDINALYLLIMCAFAVETRFSCSFLVVNISALYCRLIHILYNGTDPNMFTV